MIRKLITFGAFLTLSLSVELISCKQENKSVNGFKPKAEHVFLIGIDGWGAYSVEKGNIPNIRNLMQTGSYTLEKRAVLPSSSAPNWASMYMGAGPELHGYCEWGSQVPDLPSRIVNEHNIFPTIFSILRDQNPEAKIGNLCEWDGIRYLVDTLALDYDKHVVETGTDSTATAKYAVEYINKEKPTFFNIVFDALDHVGHAKGHDTEAYYNKLSELDKYIGDIVNAIKKTGIWNESIIIVTADHGGIGLGHGGRTMQEMETPFIIAGKGIKKNYIIEESMMQFDVASTIASIFGLKQPQVWIGRSISSIFE